MAEHMNGDKEINYKSKQVMYILTYLTGRKHNERQAREAIKEMNGNYLVKGLIDYYEVPQASVWEYMKKKHGERIEKKRVRDMDDLLNQAINVWQDTYGDE